MLIPGVMETYGHTPRPRAKPGSMALLPLGSQVLCMAPVTTESSIDMLCRCLSVTEESVPELPQRTMCVSMVLLLLGSVVMSMARFAMGVFGTILY